MSSRPCRASTCERMGEHPRMGEVDVVVIPIRGSTVEAGVALSGTWAARSRSVFGFQSTSTDSA